ncbi:hypothetical protein SVAN01_05825 [Stagonosporopsis vannaccii]|nr:hypothetical protein SVAN01_05825 [Stagonosporopsis vannaccii]
MDSLPQEIVDRISISLSRDDLKNTLLLSARFQRAAEQYSEAFTTYILTKDNVVDFNRFCSGRLVQHLRNIKVIVDVNAFENNPCRDNTEELREIDESFTRQIDFLFSTLHGLEQAGSLDGHRGLELEIYTPTRAQDKSTFCLHRVFTSWRVRVISPEKLPCIACIRSLLVGNGTDLDYHNVPDLPFRKPDLRILLDLSARLPNLRTLKCNIGGDEWTKGVSLEEARYSTQDWPGPRRDTRQDFAKALQGIQLPALHQVNLDFIYPIHRADWIDQRLPMPNLIQPSIYDPFSSSLRLLSYQLRTMRLSIVADQTLFWPADGSKPSWPKLESLSVMFHMVAPSGAWYYKGPRDVGAKEGFEINELSYPPLWTTENDKVADGEFDWDFDRAQHRILAQYRVEPNDEILVPFLAAFARAAALMPSLKEAALWSPLLFCPNDVEAYDDFDCTEVAHATEGELAWGISYLKPRTQAFTDVIGEDFAASRQMWWYVARWRPDPEIFDLFRQIGRQEHGEPLILFDRECWILCNGLSTCLSIFPHRNSTITNINNPLWDRNTTLYQPLSNAK